MSKNKPTLPELASDLIEVVGLAGDESESSISAIHRAVIRLQQDKKDGGSADYWELVHQLRSVLGLTSGNGEDMVRTVRYLKRIQAEAPIPMLLYCPECGGRHVDEGAFSTRPHHTHACQHCGLTWRPSILTTVGVRFLPGFKNEEGGQ